MPNRERMILLTEYDLRRIQDLDLDVDFYRNNKSACKPYLYEMVKEKGSCIFLSNNRCKIYEHRPLICRFYPFTMAEKDEYIFQVDNKCKGIGFDRPVEERFMRALVEEAERNFR
jgi:Fe-S-cluster containining protein